jgi:hypothetical protein
MKKVIRLTESDLTRIVKRVINEGGYESVKKDLKVRKTANNITMGLFNGIGRMMIAFGKLKTMIKGDSFEHSQYKVAEGLMDDFIKMKKTLSTIKQLVKSYKEKDVKLHKSDFEDYDIDLNEILNDLESAYDKVRDLEDLVEDDVTIRNLKALEKSVDAVVELLDSIED